MTTYFGSSDHIHFPFTFCTFSVLSTNHSMCYEEVCQARTGHVNDTEAELETKWRVRKMATRAAWRAAPHGKGQVTLAILLRRHVRTLFSDYIGEVWTPQGFSTSDFPVL